MLLICINPFNPLNRPRREASTIIVPIIQMRKVVYKEVMLLVKSHIQMAEPGFYPSHLAQIFAIMLFPQDSAWGLRLSFYSLSLKEYHDSVASTTTSLYIVPQLWNPVRPSGSRSKNYRQPQNQPKLTFIMPLLEPGIKLKLFYTHFHIASSHNRCEMASWEGYRLA